MAQEAETLHAGHGAGLLVVIVNYRVGPLVVNCLESLAREVASHPGVRAIVVDNASGDGSDEEIETAIADRGWSGWAAVRRSPVNGGFAYGNNLAIRRALAAPADGGRTAAPEFFWLLNPDTIVRPGAVAAILSFFHRHDAAGVIGTAIDDDRGARWPFAFRFHSILGEIESSSRSRLVGRLLARHSVLRQMGDDPERVDALSGASIVVRRAVFDSAGLLDENYFLYYEETDFFHLVARAGWQCWYVPAAVVVHISGQSTGLTARDSAQRRVPNYWFASRRRYLVRNYGRLHAVATDLIAISGLCCWRLRCLVRGQPHGGSPHFLRDFIARSALIRRDIHANAELARWRADQGRVTGGSEKARSPRRKVAVR